MSDPYVRTPRHLNRHRAAGLTMVEILIALVVISIGLLGVAGLHAMSLRNNYDALMRSHASALAADIIDRMRANASAVVVGSDYDNLGFGAAPTVEEDSVQALVDMSEWKETLEAQLPEGDGDITVTVAADGVTKLVKVEVRWGERGADISFITETEI
jgi:type IV pilus assembly protein PilV